MDLGKITPSEIVHDVLHPVTRKAIGVKVTLISQDDERIKRVMRGIKDDNARRRTAGKPVTSLREDEQNLEVLVACITGWSWEGDAEFDGKKPEFTEKNVREVLTRLEWFKDQLVAVINEPSNFLPA